METPLVLANQIRLSKMMEKHLLSFLKKTTCKSVFGDFEGFKVELWSNGIYQMKTPETIYLLVKVSNR